MNFRGELLYIKGEQSLLYKPFNTNVGIGVLIGYYTELNTICETGEVIHISGFNSKSTWIEKKLDIPESKRGRLWIHFDDSPMKGTGIEYDRTWETFYDAEKHYICIGDHLTSDNDDCIEFANNIIAVLRGGQLVAIWAKIKEVETVI